MTVLRRGLTVPLVTVIMVCVLVCAPLLLVVTGVAGLIVRSSRPTRTVALVMAYALLELRTLATFMSGHRDCDRLMREFLTTAHAAVRRILDVEVVLDSASATVMQIPREEPVIVLARHCGPGDSVLVAWLLAVEYRLQLRVVLKAVLQCEPVLDLAGKLGCLCFLSQGERARTQIHDLAASMIGGQALLLFPEGANFSWARWRSAITRLHSSGQSHKARRASQQSHTLPPRTGGAAAALAGAPNANVLVLTHNGFCPDGRARPWWQLPVHRELLVRTVLVPAGQLPQPAQLSGWLERTWSQVDAWVADHTEE
jgi:1-acyl-sn-glycerol-3-phosphate acyltransferase